MVLVYTLQKNYNQLKLYSKQRQNRDIHDKLTLVRSVICKPNQLYRLESQAVSHATMLKPVPKNRNVQRHTRRTHTTPSRPAQRKHTNEFAPKLMNY